MTAIIFEKRGQQAWITLDRPQAKNMLNGDMFVELADAWQEVRDDDDIRVAVLTAAGDVDFCCGGDLSQVIPLWTGAKQAQTPVEERLLPSSPSGRLLISTLKPAAAISGTLSGVICSETATLAASWTIFNASSSCRADVIPEADRRLQLTHPENRGCASP